MRNTCFDLFDNDFCLLVSGTEDRMGFVCDSVRLIAQRTETGKATVAEFYKF